MEKDELTRHALDRLKGSLWHTTSAERFASILRDRCIRVEPKIPDNERWKTSRGPNFYPFVRHVGGVSLFELKDFDSELYSENYPLSSWREFIPFREKWGKSIWVEIDRSAVKREFLSPPDVKRRWEDESAHFHTWMPSIEAAHIGDLSSTKFLAAYEISLAGITEISL